MAIHAKSADNCVRTFGTFGTFGKLQTKLTKLKHYRKVLGTFAAIVRIIDTD